MRLLPGCVFRSCAAAPRWALSSGNRQHPAPMPRSGCVTRSAGDSDSACQRTGRERTTKSDSQNRIRGSRRSRAHRLRDAHSRESVIPAPTTEWMRRARGNSDVAPDEADNFAQEVEHHDKREAGIDNKGFEEV